MAQYSIGTVTVTNGSASIIGDATFFVSNVVPGNAFKIKGSSVTYTVASVVSDTELTLSSFYQGDTASLLSYLITKDFTPNYGFAEINKGDQDWPVILTNETIRKIDKTLKDISNNVGTGGNGTAGMIHLNQQFNSTDLVPNDAGGFSWTWNHNLGVNPFVRVFDTTVEQTEHMANVTHINVNTTRIDFAYLMSGNIKAGY